MTQNVSIGIAAVFPVLKQNIAIVVVDAIGCNPQNKKTACSMESATVLQNLLKPLLLTALRIHNSQPFCSASANIGTWMGSRYLPEDKNARDRDPRLIVSLQNLGLLSSLRKPRKLSKQGTSLKNCTLFVQFREELVICRLHCNPRL